MQLVDLQRYVLPGLLALLILGVGVIVATNGRGGEPARSQQAPAQSAPTGARTGGRRFVRVRRGQTPTSIARNAGITVDRLLELNPNVDPATLRPGQTLKIRP